MTLKRSKEHLVVLRRKAVSKAKLHGQSNDQIVIWLEEEGIINPDTNQPWSVQTISNDLKEIERSWEDVMFRDITTHRARVMAEFGEVKSAAWKAGKLDTVIRAIKGEIDLLGLNELERMGTEIALANLLKGLPEKLSKIVRTQLTDRIAKKKASLTVVKNQQARIAR